MRILRVRRGFQADHSSSSYLFYAVDHPVSAAGQAIADRYSSSAEVDEQYARYAKWGERELDPEAFAALLGEHYDVMVEESYGWWTLMMAVPKTPEMRAGLAGFRDARGDNDRGSTSRNTASGWRSPSTASSRATAWNSSTAISTTVTSTRSW